MESDQPFILFGKGKLSPDRWQTRKKQLDSDPQNLTTVKPSNVLAKSFNHIKIREKKENSNTDKTNYEMIKHLRTEIGKKLVDLFKWNRIY